MVVNLAIDGASCNQVLTESQSPFRTKYSGRTVGIVYWLVMPAVLGA